MRQALCRYLVAIALGFWLGGLTFYTLVVIPTGEDLVGGTVQGFVTQQVTSYLNWIGVAVLTILLPSVIRRRQWQPACAWGVILACQLALFALHPKLDGMLDSAKHEISDPDSFYQWHQVYLGVTTAQWLAGMTYVWLLTTANNCSPAKLP